VFDEFDKKQEPRFSIFTDIWVQSRIGIIFCGRETFRWVARESFRWASRKFFKLLGRKSFR
jgi:hypothetical protein